MNRSPPTQPTICRSCSIAIGQKIACSGRPCEINKETLPWPIYRWVRYEYTEAQGQPLLTGPRLGLGRSGKGAESSRLHSTSAKVHAKPRTSVFACATFSFCQVPTAGQRKGPVFPVYSQLGPFGAKGLGSVADEGAQAPSNHWTPPTARLANLPTLAVPYRQVAAKHQLQQDKQQNNNKICNTNTAPSLRQCWREFLRLLLANESSSCLTPDTYRGNGAWHDSLLHLLRINHPST